MGLVFHVSVTPLWWYWVTEIVAQSRSEEGGVKLGNMEKESNQEDLFPLLLILLSKGEMW